MATDSSRKPSRRRPTRRASARPDARHSKPTGRTPSGSGTRRSRQATTARQGGRHAGQGRRAAAGSDANRSQESPATSYESLTRGAQRRVYGERGPRRKGAGNAAAALIGIAVVAVLALGGLLFWTHRAVAVSVNGSQEKVRINSTLEDVRSALDIVTKPGDYVTVSGKTIEKDKGHAFSARVNGKELSPKKADEYRVRGGEEIEITDGGNRMESYDVTYRETQPKLVFQGSWGAVSFIKQWGKVGKQEIRKGKESGETADGDWVDELQDCIVMTKNVEPENDEKLVALTFDDGPAATYTEEYLKILKEHDAKATFFHLSPNETEYPEIAKKVVEEGHQICSHTNQHLQLSTLGAADFLQEVSSSHDTIRDVAGVETSVIRPPYGDFSQNCWLISEGTISASILWNQDTLDWSLPGVDAIVQNALTDIQPGSVILMHDGGGPRDQDVEALPQIIERLQSQGYKFVTISELMASDPDIPEEVAKGDAQMPKDAVWPTEIGEATVDVG
ncbi:MAG: polysaccharide deacetylase family protein [Acidobacteriota bacterium]|nr:polysaccharide deacetylase family protein [Acidobacteriota bacterium]